MAAALPDWASSDEACDDSFLSHQEDSSSNRYQEHQAEITVGMMGSPSPVQNQCCSTVFGTRDWPAALIVSEALEYLPLMITGDPQLFLFSILPTDRLTLMRLHYPCL